MFTEDSDCSQEQKPKTIEKCNTDEMKECKPKWHYSEWTEVSF